MLPSGHEDAARSAFRKGAGWDRRVCVGKSRGEFLTVEKPPSAALRSLLDIVSNSSSSSINAPDDNTGQPSPASGAGAPPAPAGVVRRIKRLLGGSFIVYALLVATHLGEFWPFSIYPMFSRGGYPWVRSIVRDVTPTDTQAAQAGGDPLALALTDSLFWEGVDIDRLEGIPFPLEPAGINQNDVANFVSKSTDWNERRIAAMRKIYGDILDRQSLLVYRVDGRLLEDRSVDVVYTPYILMTPDTTVITPAIRPTGGER